LEGAHAEVDPVASIHEQQTTTGRPGFFSRHRWLVTAIVVIAIAIAVVLVVAYSGGGGSGGAGGGGGY
jgi:hypothetical protein